MFQKQLSAWSPFALGVLRIMAGLLFMAHGTQKFLAFPPGSRAGAGWDFSGPGAFAGVIELGAGALIAAGILTRPAAFLASGTMAVAYFMSHAPRNFWPINNGGELAVLYCFVFLYFVFSGPGALSLESLFGRRR